MILSKDQMDGIEGVLYLALFFQLFAIGADLFSGKDFGLFMTCAIVSLLGSAILCLILYQAIKRVMP